MAAALLAAAHVLCVPASTLCGPGSFTPDFPSDSGRRGDLRPQAPPDIAGPGFVSTAGDVWMKTTNVGVIGNPFTAQSSDPSAQWPGPSGIEHLFFVGLWVGAKDRMTPDLNRLRRVSQNTEWRPPTLDAVDRIYESGEGAPGGDRLLDDDGDGQIDEDPLDGRDNDGNNGVDEDYAALSQQMLSCVLRDDTPEASQTATTEAHLPLGLEAHQRTYAFSLEGERGYTAVEYVIRNVTDHALDSVYVAFLVDQDVGPVADSRYYLDDLVEPRIPQGPVPGFPLPSSPTDDPDNPNHNFVAFVSPDDPLYQAEARCVPFSDCCCPCARDVTPINGFTMVDDDGDAGLTTGASTFLLLGHTVDGLGQRAPEQIGFRMFDAFRPGAPFSQGGLPTNDQERYQLISSTRNISGGRITASLSLEPDDYSCVVSVGPFPTLAPGESIEVTWALAVAEIDYTAPQEDIYRRYRHVVANASAAQLNYRGVYEVREGFLVPDSVQYGRETPVFAPADGPGLDFADCRDEGNFGGSRYIQAGQHLWFDLDCDICTGVPYHYLRHWVHQSGPPVSPGVEFVPGDRQVTVSWDNRSERTPDPGTGEFDLKGYSIWHASGWSRSGGTIGPSDVDWALLATYYYYDAENPLVERVIDPGSGQLVTVETTDVLVNRAWQSGSPGPQRIHARSVPCVTRPDGSCDTTWAKKPSKKAGRVLENYPVPHWEVGRWGFTDQPVLNGFLYFYAVVPFDSTGRPPNPLSSSGRRAAREAEGVVPQASQAASGSVIVVPNPYRASADWDLGPTPADPTGTHIDFQRLPPDWTALRIYTAAGDLVEEILPGDFQPNGRPQRETPDDGQASWNLVTRNGQEVVSGIYLFTVQAPDRTRQGKFVVIR